LAEDAVQETFLAAFKSRHTYRAEFSVRTWLWTILLNELRRQGGRESRTPQLKQWPTGSPGGSEFDPASAEPAPLAQVLAQERNELLNELLDRLPAPQADALRLRFFGELKFKEIADVLDCTLLTAKNRVKAGLLKLAEWTRGEGSGPEAPRGSQENQPSSRYLGDRS
jgi:RNA polymerase sigma-70 factor (ECF subfamily)